MAKSLYDKIVYIYPELVHSTVDENGNRVRNWDWAYGPCILQDDGRGEGAYIAKWEHPTLPRPTEEQLAAVPEEEEEEEVVSEEGSE